MTLTQYILENLQKTILRNREYYLRISNQADTIIVWLVGFSIASIALTISNNQVIENISEKLPVILILFSSLTIIFGVLYRTFLYIAQSLENQILVNFESYVESYSNPPEINLPREIDKNETIENLVIFLREDFKVEMDKIKIENLTPKQITKIQNSLSNLYDKLAAINLKHYESQLRQIKEILMSQLGYSEKRADRIINPKKPFFNIKRIYWFSIYFSSSLFILATLSFISGFSIFLVIYLSIQT